MKITARPTHSGDFTYCSRCGQPTVEISTKHRFMDGKVARGYECTSCGFFVEPKQVADIPIPCECERPGHFNCGVSGILARIEDCRIVGRVERCDTCQRYKSDEDALEQLKTFYPERK